MLLDTGCSMLDSGFLKTLTLSIQHPASSIQYPASSIYKQAADKPTLILRNGLSFLVTLTELNQNPVGGFGVQECDLGTTGSDSGLFVD